MTYNAVINRAIKYTENKVVKIPTPKVRANPFTGPDPKTNNIAAAIKVVMLASKIVDLDFKYPLSNARILLFSFLISSLILS